jgi:hypothetical protein
VYVVAPITGKISRGTFETPSVESGDAAAVSDRMRRARVRKRIPRAVVRGRLMSVRCAARRAEH